jgi:hypothetical protein
MTVNRPTVSQIELPAEIPRMRQRRFSIAPMMERTDRARIYIDIRCLDGVEETHIVPLGIPF